MHQNEPINIKKYSAFLFDMDGTLVDSERLKGQALSDTCKLFGGIADVNVYKDVMGETWINVANHFFTKANISPNIDDFNAKFRIRYQQLLSEQLQPNRNVVPLLMKIKESGIKCGLVSSASQWMVNHAVDQLNLSEYFDIIICKEHVTHHKPHPEAYLKAISELNLNPEDVLIFEDSNAGLIAAENANCDAIAFRHSFNINNDFKTALKIITDFKVISDELSG
jgi:HAD superfamily hydrolase (TIGR01509 family)